MAGDALATGRNGNATVSNNAGFSHAAAVAIIGSDLITAGDGDDWIAGDAMATDGGRAELITTGDDVSSLSRASRSDEHTSELQSLMRISYADFCLKNKNNALYNIYSITHITNT